jgi:hypothetical protein
MSSQVLQKGRVAEGHPERKHLDDIITRRTPLGPPFTEALINTSPDVFRQLYDETNHVHRTTRSESPYYIVGRKGSGKTAFLVGGALAEDRDVVLVQSEHIYTEVNRLRACYEAANGPLVADSLVNVWQVLLFHAAMWGLARSERLPNSQAKQRVWSYMSSFGDPLEIEADELLARVSAHMTDALLSAPQRLSFREACWSIEPGRGSFLDAAAHARTALEEAGSNALYVVVDNLEDLHKHLDDFEAVVTALFRVTSHSIIASDDRKLPFACRFAFPAELLPQLRRLAANPEKDFLDYVIVRWTAAELMVVVGNRLRTFLDIHFPTSPRRIGLPSRHDPADRQAAEQTLRALLPDEVTNGYGWLEDPVAYLMRHTQLLPRHLIQILNEIVSEAALGLGPRDTPRASEKDVIRGVRAAEHRIVEGILTTYSYQYPDLGDALSAIKNHAAVVESVSELHRIFNNASVARVGMDFDEFLEACISVGALGVVIRDEHGRYVDGEFSYTFADDVRPVEDRDRLCIHPLFMYRFFDHRAIARLKGTTNKAVYPYGSDLSHDNLEV